MTGDQLVAEVLPILLSALVVGFGALSLLLASIHGYRNLRQQHERRVLSELRTERLALAAGEDDIDAIQRLLTIPASYRPTLQRAVAQDMAYLRGAPTSGMARILGAWNSRDRWLRERRSWSSARRAEAARALGLLEDSSLLWALLPLLRDRVPEVRVAAARSLGRLRAPESAMRILEAVDSDRPLAAWVAIDVLGKIPHAHHYVQQGLRSRSPLVRETAARVAGEYGLVGAAPALRHAARREEQPRTLCAIVDALSVVGNARDDDLLKELALEHSSRLVRIRCLEGAVRRGELETALLMVDATDETICDAAVRALARTEEGAAALRSLHPDHPLVAHELAIRQLRPGAAP